MKPFIQLTVSLFAFVLVQCSMAPEDFYKELKASSAEVKASQRPCSQTIGGDILRLNSIDARYLNPDCFFKHERKDSTVEPRSGLALSGGGIRSNAYHLGFLSGMHQIGALGKLDYIASVSGGGWAHGTYQAYEGTDTNFFACLENAASTTRTRRRENQCSSHFRNCQIPNREGWRKDIVQFHLNGRDIPLSKLTEIRGQQGRPYPIFYATHHYFNRKLRARTWDCDDFPFEYTPHLLGSQLNCTFDERSFFNWFPKGKPVSGQYLRHKTDSISFSNNKVLSKKLLLADALRASSCFYPPLVGYQFYINYQEKGNNKSMLSPPGIIDLADGGQTDNFGLITLLERRVPLIILSDMSYVPDASMQEITKAANYARRFFDFEIKFESGKYACEECKEKHCYDIQRTFVEHEIIYRSNRNLQETYGKLISIRPTRAHMQAFLKYLKHIDREDLSKAIEFDRDFPRLGTVSPCYSDEMILALYYMGRFTVFRAMQPICESLNIANCTAPSLE